MSEKDFYFILLITEYEWTDAVWIFFNRILSPAAGARP